MYDAVCWRISIECVIFMSRTVGFELKNIFFFSIKKHMQTSKQNFKCRVFFYLFVENLQGKYL